MGRKRGRYSPEFKVEDVRLVMVEHRTPARVARALGMAESTLNRWVAAERDKASPEGAPSQQERAEIRALRKRVRELEMERELLKRPRTSSPGRLCERLPLHSLGEGYFPMAFMCRGVDVSHSAFYA